MILPTEGAGLVLRYNWRMDVNRYKQRLLELEARLSAQTTREREEARGQVLDGPGDSGDVSVTEEARSAEFADADRRATTLQQVREALERIADGTYGQCVVDGGPIEPQRLEAVPWTPYCLKHQEEFDQSGRQKTPTL
jgi:RNA polymerase-binding transcription factor